MSDSVRPHIREPTRLPHPWDSPGKNTGVGCHFLLQCMKVKSESEVAQLCPTLSDPMDCSLPGSSIHGFSRQEYWSGVPLPSPIRYLHSCNKDLIKRPNLLPTEREIARFPGQTAHFPTRSHLNCRNHKLGEWPDLPLKGQSKVTDHTGLLVLGPECKRRNYKTYTPVCVSY